MSKRGDREPLADLLQAIQGATTYVAGMRSQQRHIRRSQNSIFKNS